MFQANPTSIPAAHRGILPGTDRYWAEKVTDVGMLYETSVVNQQFQQANEARSGLDIRAAWLAKWLDQKMETHSGRLKHAHRWSMPLI